MNRTYRGRRAASIENGDLRVTVLAEGGHIAEIFDKVAGVSPLWIPPWPTIEPSAFPHAGDAYGSGSDARLLAGIMGHNLCLDLFGPPSEDEARRGIGAHGEGPVAAYEIDAQPRALWARAALPLAGLEVQRHLELDGRVLRVLETVTNVSGADRAVGWTQHVTLGPPFLEPGVTEFRASATHSRVFDTRFGDDDYLAPGETFGWPYAPTLDGGCADLRVLRTAGRSSAFSAHLMDPDRPAAFFVAFHRGYRLAFGYVWKPGEFPWMGIWEEQHSRQHAPWNGRTLARGMEFGVSPMPETRGEMIDRGPLFGVPTVRVIPARQSVSATYCAIARGAQAIPESLDWPA